MTPVSTWEQFFIFFSREGMRMEVENIKKVYKMLQNAKKSCQKDKRDHQMGTRVLIPATSKFF